MRANALVRALQISLLGGTLLASTAALADSDWDSLAPEQQQVLSDFRERWDSMPPDRRERLKAKAERWRSMPPEQRDALRERWRALKPLPPEAREALRQKWPSLSPEERRDAMRDLHRQYGAPGRPGPAHERPGHDRDD